MRTKNPMTLSWIPGRHLARREEKERIVSLGWATLALSFAGARESAITHLTKLKSLDLDQLSELKVATVDCASKRSQWVSDAPSSVSIVTSEDIEDRIPQPGRTLRLKLT